MQKVSEVGVVKYNQAIGGNGLNMEIRVETTSEGVKVNAPVKRSDTTIACLSRETDGSVFLSVNKNANLSLQETQSLFTESFNVLNDLNIAGEAEQEEEEEPENQEES